LVINQHESYEPSEIVRITKPAGIFLTQQVGGTNSMEINEAFGVDINSAFGDWNLTTALAELDMQHFEVISSNEEYPVQRFYDVGALVYYLKAVPWQVPNFTTQMYEQELYAIHEKIQADGYFDVIEHRFMMRLRVK